MMMIKIIITNNVTASSGSSLKGRVTQLSHSHIGLLVRRAFWMVDVLRVTCDV
jgi:hypothetical protein